MIGFAGRSIIASICVGLGLLLAGSASAAMGIGDIGEPCLADGTCSNGVCVGGVGGFCAPCGMPGKAACPGANPDDPAWCHLDGWGYAPAATASGSFCINSENTDCGQVGTLACDRDNRPFCYYGIASGSRLGTVCIACGGIGEACCVGTDRVCDTGSCQAGICRLDPPKPADPAKAIEKAITECRFDAARRAIAALDPNDPDRQALSRWLKDAAAVEAHVDQLLEWAKEGAALAKDVTAKGDLAVASLYYAQARTNLEAARDMTRCPGDADKLDEASLSALIADQQALEAMIVDQFARHVAACRFDEAAEHVRWGEKNGFDNTALMAKRLEEARVAERQARDAYSRGAVANARGNDLMTAGDPKGALAAYSEARTQFGRARQLTACEATRDAIDVAIRDVGANEVAAGDAADKASAGQAGGGSGGIAAAGPVDPTPPDAHPCLDSSIPADAFMTSYMRFMGGGGTTIYLKGQYICGKVHHRSSFEIFDGSTITGYHCDKQGNRYVNCEVSNTYTITEVYNVDNNAVDYHYKCGPNHYWIHVVPKTD